MTSSVFQRVLTLMIALAATTSSTANDEVEFLYSYYDDDGELTVKSPALRLSLDWLSRYFVGAKYVYETFEKTAPDDAIDAVSGATTVSGGSGTGFKETRNELSGSFAYKRGDTTYAAGNVASVESDFYSITNSVGVSQELFDKNLTVAALASYGVDDVEVEDDEYEHKYSGAVTFTATQLLSPTALVLGGYSYNRISGYQESPLRKIRYDIGFGVYAEAEERHPDERTRQTVFVRGKKYFTTRTGLDLNIAHYQDDWGIKSNAAELRVNQYLASWFIAQFRYRYYTQSEADFYEPIYLAAQDEMTADPRLREFVARLFGLKGTLLVPLFGQKSSLSFSIDKYSETNGGVTAMIIQAGALVPF